MKHLITCLALGMACAAGAQVNGFEPPYNPDSNADAFIGTQRFEQHDGKPLRVIERINKVLHVSAVVFPAYESTEFGPR